MIRMEHISIMSESMSNSYALDDINLSFPNKGMIFIVEKNDQTIRAFFNILGGIEQPTKGKVYLQNQELNVYDEKAMNQYRRDVVGLIFDENNLIEHQSILENMLLPLKIQGKTLDQKVVDDLLKFAHLEDVASSSPWIHQQQRVAIARALMKDSKIILAEEPTQNVSQENKQEIFEILKSISKDRLVIIVTRYEELARAYGDRLIMLEHGKIMEDENLHEIPESRDPVIKRGNRPTFSFLLHSSLENIQNRKAKILLALILTLISILFFILSFSFVLLDDDEVYIQSIKNNGESHVILDGGLYPEYVQLHSGDEFNGIYHNYGIRFFLKDEPLPPWNDIITEVHDFDDFHVTFLYGSKPNSYYELAISDYIADIMVKEQFNSSISMEKLIGRKFWYNLTGRNGNFLVTITGIINTQHPNSDDIDFTTDVKSTKCYVNFGFHEYHLKEFRYAYGEFQLSYNDLSSNAGNILLNGESPTVIKESKLENVEVYTSSGISDISEITLKDNEAFINLFYYNQLFQREDHITFDQLNTQNPLLDQVVTLSYTNSRVVGEPNYMKTVVIKGILFDSDNEPLTNQNNSYNYDASGIMVSDVLFDELTEFNHRPYEYMIDVNHSNFATLVEEYGPFSSDRSDYLRAWHSLYPKDIKDFEARYQVIFTIIWLVTTFLAMILIYKNNTYDDRYQKNSHAIFRSLGVGRLQIFQTIFQENIFLFLLVVPLGYLIKYISFKSIHYSLYLSEHYISAFYINGTHIILLLLYVFLLIFLSIFIPIHKLLRKTTAEIIRFS